MVRILLFLGVLMGLSLNAQTKVRVDLSLRLEAINASSNAVDFLVGQQQKDGSFSQHPGITAMAVIALAESPRKEDKAVKGAIEKARTFLLAQISETGHVSRTKVDEDVYSTAVCLMALRVLNPESDEAVRGKLRDYLVNLQIKKGRSMAYGGLGYKTNDKTTGYPDLSNTHWALEAIRLSRTQKPNGKTVHLWKKADSFVSSCQVKNANSPAEGGFLYYPIGNPPKKAAHKDTDRVWGSLSLGAVKSLRFAGVKSSDDRIKLALKWFGANYTLKENPGLKQGGYYYYCYMYASCMLFLGQDEIQVENRKRNWREDMIGELLSRQKNGSHWANSNALWMEGNPVLCTSYALKALSLALVEPPKRK